MSDQFIQKFFTSRDNNITSAEFVGDQDRLWYDPITNTIRVWTGDPGGKPVLGGGGTSNISILNQGTLITNAASSLNFFGDGVGSVAAGSAVTITIPGNYFYLDGGEPDQSYNCGPLPAKIGFEWDGGNCINLGGVV